MHCRNLGSSDICNTHASSPLSFVYFRKKITIFDSNVWAFNQGTQAFRDCELFPALLNCLIRLIWTICLYPLGFNQINPKIIEICFAVWRRKNFHDLPHRNQNATASTKSELCHYQTILSFNDICSNRLYPLLDRLHEAFFMYV